MSKFKRVAVNDVTLLGSPLSCGAALTQCLESRLSSIRLLRSRLLSLHSHDALLILKNSLSIPSLQHILRTSWCGDHPLLTAFDDQLRSCLSALANVNLEDWQWNQASLPVNAGGLGIRQASHVAPSAYLASLHSTRNLVDMILHNFEWHDDVSVANATTYWQSLGGNCPPEGESANSQKCWDQPIVNSMQCHLLETVRDRSSRARLLAAATPNSYSWLSAAPLVSAGLRLSDTEVRIAIGLRLGSSICAPHSCRCGAEVDATGTHGLSCQRSAGRIIRHSLLNDTFCCALQRANIPCRKEPQGLLVDSALRPDGETLLPWSMGKCLAWDVTCVDTLAPCHLHRTAISSGTAAAQAAIDKRRKYADLSPTHIFMPLAAETLGPWDKSALEFINELGKRISAITGDAREMHFIS